jgi:hypothetical protein
MRFMQVNAKQNTEHSTLEGGSRRVALKNPDEMTKTIFVSVTTCSLFF